MSCNSCAVYKNEISELMKMTELIMTKLKWLNQNHSDENGASTSPDITDLTGGAQDQTMDQESNESNDLQQQTTAKPSSASGSSSENVDNRFVSNKRPKYDGKIWSSLSTEPLFQPSQLNYLDSLVTKNDSVSTNSTKTNVVKSLYLSGFKPSVEESHILKFLSGHVVTKNIVDSLKCTKLVRKNRKQPLNFVSFKLDIPRQHYDLVSNPVLWQTTGPDNVIFKEFVDKRSLPLNQTAVGKQKQPILNPNALKSQPHKSKNTNGMENQQKIRSTQTPKGQKNPYKWQRAQHRPNLCQKSCCNRQQQQQQHQHHRQCQSNCCTDRCAGNQPGCQRQTRH